MIQTLYGLIQLVYLGIAYNDIHFGNVLLRIDLGNRHCNFFALLHDFGRSEKDCTHLGNYTFDTGKLMDAIHQTGQFEDEVRLACLMIDEVDSFAEIPKMLSSVQTLFFRYSNGQVSIPMTGFSARTHISVRISNLLLNHILLSQIDFHLNFPPQNIFRKRKTCKLEHSERIDSFLNISNNVLIILERQCNSYLFSNALSSSRSHSHILSVQQESLICRICTSVHRDTIGQIVVRDGNWG